MRSEEKKKKMFARITAVVVHIKATITSEIDLMILHIDIMYIKRISYFPDAKVCISISCSLYYLNFFQVQIVFSHVLTMSIIITYVLILTNISYS